MDIKYNDHKIYYGPVLVGYDGYAADTKSFPFGADKNGDWHFAANEDEVALWNNPNIHARVIDIVAELSLTVEAAEDPEKFREFLDAAYEQNATGMMSLDGAGHKVNLYMEDLARLASVNIDTKDARIMTENFVIESMRSDKIDWGYGDGSGRTAEWTWETMLNGGEAPVFYLMAKTKPSTGTTVPLHIGDGVVNKGTNIVRDYISARPEHSQAEQADFVLLDTNLFPQGIEVEYYSEYGPNSDYYLFGMDGEKYAVAMYTNSELNELMPYQNPRIGYVDGNMNVGAMWKYYVARLFSFIKMKEAPVPADKIIVCYTETERTTKKNLAGKEPVYAPEWALPAIRKMQERAAAAAEAESNL